MKPLEFKGEIFEKKMMQCFQKDFVRRVVAGDVSY